MHVEVFVNGRARSKGSMRPIANWSTQKVRQVEEVADSKAWRSAIVNAMIPVIADQQVDRWLLREGYPWVGPVGVALRFVLPHEAGDARLAARMTGGWPTLRRYGDIDKLTRNVLDALSAPKKKGDLCAGLYQDDSLVCRLDVTKRFVNEAVPEDEAGVLITAWELE